MKHRLFLSLALLGLFFNSCWQAPQPPATRDVKVLATVQATLETNGAASAQLVPNTRSSRSALPDTAISFTRKFSSIFEDETNKQRYLSATFEVTNSSGQDFKNLTFYAYTQAADSIGGTAIKKMINFGLNAINSPSVAQNIKPTHGMKHLGANVVVNPDEADFQAFQWNEASAVQDAARALGTIQGNDELLEYGFVARSALGGRAIGNNGKGFITIALKLPKQTDKSIDPYKFVMTFVLADDAVTRVTRSIEESTSEAEARAAALNASEVVLIGPDLDTVTGRTTIRVANTKIGNAPTALLESKLFLTSVAPLEMTNDQTTAITITGQEFNADTSFFLESTKLEVTSVNPNRATLKIPAGFEPALYGLIAVNPDGARATLYPGFSIKAGAPARRIDPQLRARSYVDGYVIDYATQQPLKDAKIGLQGGIGTLEATTDVNGYFLIRGVPAGQNVFKIDHDGYESVYRNANVLGDAQTMTLQLSALEPINPVTTSIGAQGGTHYANGSTPDDGFLVVPPGALEKPTNLQFTQLHTPQTMPELPENNLFTAFAKLEPSGLVFKKPATLFLPIASDLRRRVGQKLIALYFDTHTSKWVNGVTSGVVSSINGKLFAEYEILHFSYAGASQPEPCYIRDPQNPNILLPCPPSSPDNNTSSTVRTCVLYEDGTPAFNMTTNWGVTDADGEFRGRIAGLKPGSSQTAKVIGNGDAVPVSAVVDESGNLDFPCIRIPNLTPGSPTAPSIDTIDNCDPPLPSPMSAPNPIQTRGIQTRVAPIYRLVTPETMKGTTSEVPNYRKYNIDPSKTRLTIGDIDFTDKAVIQPNPNNPENLLVKLTFSQPLPAQVGLEIKLSVETKEGKKGESSSFADIVAQFKVPNVAYAVIPNDAYPESVVTPAILENDLGRSYIYRERDVTDNKINLSVPVKALDEKGKLLPLTRVTYVRFSNDGSSISLFENGVANIPMSFSVSETNTVSQPIGQLLVDGIQAQSVKNRSSRINCREGLNVVTPDGKEPVMISIPKSVGQRIGEFFSWGAMQALGLLPMVSGAIDCGKGAYALIANTEVDLLETEIGCVGMSLDAVITAAAIADACATCPGYLANKSIMIFLKTVNRISKVAGGYLSRGILALFEKFRNGLISAGEFVARVQEFGFLKQLFEEGGEAGVNKAENFLKDILERCASGVRSIRITTRAVACDVDAAKFLELLNKAGSAISKAFPGMTLTEALLLCERWLGRYYQNEAAIRAAYGVTGNFDEWVLKQLENFGKAADRALVAGGTKTEWISPAGIKYGIDRQHGTKVIHILEHLPNAVTAGPGDTFFNLASNEVFGLIDEAWLSSTKFIIDPADPAKWVYDAGRVIGTRGETFMRIIVKPNSNPPEILSAYPCGVLLPC